MMWFVIFDKCILLQSIEAGLRLLFGGLQNQSDNDTKDWERLNKAEKEV